MSDKYAKDVNVKRLDLKCSAWFTQNSKLTKTDNEARLRFFVMNDRRHLSLLPLFCVFFRLLNVVLNAVIVF